MAKLRTVTLLALLFGLFSIAAADNLQINGASPTADSAHPTRGMTQARVEATFGSPDAKIAPVGDPPIARWEYKDFVVFFEYDRVIHSVVKR
ncbi:MAG: hypothetical protein ACO22K_05475 [Woeseiaceae bacterium]|jgi:hypothetical protein